MAPSFLSLASLTESIIRRRFSSSGLSLQTQIIDSETTIQFWGPPISPSPNNEQKPVLLLLHGFGTSAIWQWSYQVKPLSRFFRLYIPDLVFFGGSTTTCRQNRSEIFQAKSMGKLMEKLGIEKFNVAGTSYGGFVAYNMAKMMGEKVEKVVIASSGVNMKRSDNEGLMERAKGNEVAEILLPCNGEELRKMLAMVASISSSKLRYVPDFLLNDFCQKMFSKKREEKLQLLEALTIGKDNSTNVSPIPQDVMLIWGDQDQIFPLKMAYELKELLGKKARLKVIDRTSHIPQTQKPKQFNAILKSFFLS